MYVIATIKVENYILIWNLDLVRSGQLYSQAVGKLELSD